MAAPQVQDLATIMAQLDPAYAQSRNLYQGQVAALPGQLQQTMQGIETDKNNAFSGIAKSANTRGLDFWGTPIEEQSKYLGGTYLTSKNNATAANTNAQTALQQALASLYQDQYKQALGTQGNQQSQANDYQKMQEQQAFQAQQAALDRAQKSQSTQGSTVSYVRNKNGGYDLINGDGTRNNTLDLASYVKLNGGGISDLLNFLSEGDAQDKKAVTNYYNNTKKGMTATQALQQLQKDRPTAFYKGGKL